MKRGLGHSLGGNEGNTQECENASQFWGKRITNPTWILFFFFTLASKGHFWHIINCIAFVSILRLCLGVGLNSVTYMDHLLIFGPSWAQNTILPKKIRREIPYLNYNQIEVQTIKSE